MNMKNRYYSRIFNLKTLLLISLLLGIVLRTLPYFIVGYPTDTVAGGGLFYQFSETISNNGFWYPENIPFYSEGGVPFAYNPLVFYLISALAELLPVSIFTLHVNVPPIISVLTLFAFYYLSREIFSDQKYVVLATFIFATTPAAYTAFIDFIGLAEASGTLIFIVCLIVLSRTHTYKSNYWVFLAGFSVGIAALTLHGALLASVIAVFTYSINAYMNGHEKFAIKSFIGIGIISLIVSSPWWGSVIVRHGFETFIYAFSSRSGSPLGLIRGIVGMDSFLLSTTLIGVAFIGAVSMFMRKKLAIPLLFIFLFPWGEIVYLKPVVATLLVPIGIFDVVLPALMNNTEVDLKNWTDNSFNFRTVGVFVLIGAIMLQPMGFAIGIYMGGDYLDDAHSINENSDDLKSAANWAEENTCMESKYLYIGAGVPFSEWFPALANRHVINAQWGTEWEGNWSRYGDMNDEIQSVSNRAELNQILSDHGLSPDYIFIETSSAPTSFVTDVNNNQSQIVYQNQEFIIASIDRQVGNNTVEKC